MELQASRTRARISPSGNPVLLLDQDRSRWAWLLVGRGLSALERVRNRRPARAVHDAGRHRRLPRSARVTDLYDGVAQLMPSPVVELNRAVAVAMTFGPRAALEIVDALREEPALDDYHLLLSVPGDLLEKLGRLDEARAEFERAALLTANSRRQAALLEWAATCATRR